MTRQIYDSLKYSFIITGIVLAVMYILYCMFMVMGAYFFLMISAIGFFGLVALIHYILTREGD